MLKTIIFTILILWINFQTIYANDNISIYEKNIDIKFDQRNINNVKTPIIKDNISSHIEKLKNDKNETEEKNNSLALIIILLLFIISYIGYKYYKSTKLKKIKNEYKTKTLQILKTGNEYSIEYNGVYNKGIKVMESNKDNITTSIDSFVKTMNKLTKTRGKNILEELNNLDIEIPNLEESGNTIYRLFLPDNIRQEIENQNGCLIIKTDEQEIPWELMHDGHIFLALKFPIARHIMTRERIRTNSKSINKKPKILFIVNPTSDLPGTEGEVKNIIKKLGKKANISILKGSNANSIKVFSALGKNDRDIIHYSGHAFFNKNEPDESGLVLDNQQIISAGEIKRSLNGNPLIFLNACSSGKSISINEDFTETGVDTIGLASSFIIGGSKGVISTMWPVNDNIAEKFAIDFYTKFIKGNSIGESILEAKQNSFSENTKNVTWASFIYYGDPDLTINQK